MSRPNYGRQRSYSETDVRELTVRDPGPLYLSRSHMRVSHTTTRVGEAIILDWYLADPSSANDWIGLYDIGKTNKRVVMCIYN